MAAENCCKVYFGWGELKLKLSEEGKILFSAWSSSSPEVISCLVTGFSEYETFEVEPSKWALSIRAWVNSAFAGRYHEIPLDLSRYHSGFQQEVVEGLIRFGSSGQKLFSYKSLAKLLGRPQAARAVSRALATNPFVFFRPCHLVVPERTRQKIKSELNDLTPIFGERGSWGIHPIFNEFDFGGYQGGVQLKVFLLKRMKSLSI
jgi:O6-methylguanine-DNA--protein-cysteine methyltransferase